MTHFARTVLVAAALVAPGLAAADEAPPSRYDGRPDTVTGILGVGAPTGVLGVEYEHALARWLTVAGGAGIGTMSPQGAAMVRVRAAGDSVAFGVGGGGSYGGARIDHMELLGPGSHDELHGSLWVNSEVYLERRSAAGTVLRLDVGAGKAVRTASCQHVDEAGIEFLGGYREEEVRPCSEERALPVLPFVGLAMGKAF